MKKFLLSAAFMLAVGTASGQVFSENFDTFADLAPAGWISTNQSVPTGTGAWTQGGGTAFPGGSYNGTEFSFALVNYTSATGNGTISNWLITPVISLENGDVISFYTRKGGDGTGTIYPDRLELRISTNGAASVTPSGSATNVGDFTTLAVSVNPDLNSTDYPFTWTQYTYTVSGLTGPTDSKLAFRYFVTDGGTLGTNSDIIAIDALSVDRELSTADFFRNNFAMYPNPAKDVLNISANTVELSAATITDINGRVVKQQSVNGMSAEINVSELNAGVYFVSVQSAEGKGTAKFIKN